MLVQFAILILSHPTSSADMRWPILQCEQTISSSHSPTDKLISFLHHLIAEGHWAKIEEIHHLEGFLMGSVPTLPPGSGPELKNRMIEKTLSGLVNRGFEREAVRSWAQMILQEFGETQSNRNAVELSARATLRKLKFVRVPRGPIVFENGYKGIGQRFRKAVLPYDFEVMDSPVTQAQWLEVMGDLPEGAMKHIPEVAIVSVISRGRAFRIAPDFPVTGFGQSQLVRFANELAKRRGLNPAYQYDSGADPGDPRSVELSSDRYSQIEGYRLPSYAEWRRMMHDNYTHLESLPDFNDRELALNDQGVFRNGQSVKLLSVATKDPLWFSGHPIFDLLGLVEEPFHGIEVAVSKMDRVPIGPPFRYIRGAGGSFERPCQIVARVGNVAIYRADLDCRQNSLNSEDVGFRLVRTLK